MSYC